MSYYEPFPLDNFKSNRVEKPWGYYDDVFRSDKYVLKTICVMPGKKLSLQRHKLRSEIWKVLSGRATVQIGNQRYYGDPERVFEIPVDEIHRLENCEDKPLLILELQMGECREDDIIRLEDDWGRK